MRREGLVWENGPDVSVNANTSDSHYEPTAEHSAPIREGDFLLIDIWGRLEQAGQRVLRHHLDRRDRPRAERPKSSWCSIPCATRATRPSQTVEAGLRSGRPIRGFEADDAARAVIRERASASSSRIAPDTTSRTRFTVRARTWTTSKPTTCACILPHTCFSVEPGIYLPEFGVRSEINMITRPGKAWVQGGSSRNWCGFRAVTGHRAPGMSLTRG